MPSSQGCQRDSKSHGKLLRGALCAAGGEPEVLAWGPGGGGPSASCPPPPCLCEVTRCCQGSPAHLPFLSPLFTIRGSLEGGVGRRQMENKERTKGASLRGQKAGGLLSPSGPGPSCPHQRQACATPGCRPPGLPLQRLALASQGSHLLGDPQKVILIQATFFLSVKQKWDACRVLQQTPPLSPLLESLRPVRFFPPSGRRGSGWVPTSTHREDLRVPGQVRQTGSLCSQHLGAGCKHLPGMNE